MDEELQMEQEAEAPAAPWRWDQGPNAPALTTYHVLNGSPILRVTHYADDSSWAFLCGKTDDIAEALLVPMERAVSLDPTLAAVNDLQPGWSAYRSAIGSPWSREKNDFE
ncbi:MAG: hypothetical protein IPO55_08430 [Alphaproteobacteria bacterium]|nr:hypothetical protein [Alphaproteobacteria bacterium]